MQSSYKTASTCEGLVKLPPEKISPNGKWERSQSEWECPNILTCCWQSWGLSIEYRLLHSGTFCHVLGLLFSNRQYGNIGKELSIHLLNDEEKDWQECLKFPSLPPVAQLSGSETFAPALARKVGFVTTLALYTPLHWSWNSDVFVKRVDGKVFCSFNLLGTGTRTQACSYYAVLGSLKAGALPRSCR